MELTREQLSNLRYAFHSGQDSEVVTRLLDTIDALQARLDTLEGINKAYDAAVAHIIGLQRELETATSDALRAAANHVYEVPISEDEYHNGDTKHIISEAILALIPDRIRIAAELRELEVRLDEHDRACEECKIHLSDLSANYVARLRPSKFCERHIELHAAIAAKRKELEGVNG